MKVNIHSDDAGVIQHLNQEAAKAMSYGVQAGIPVTRDQALRWITANPAWTLGIDSVVGTLEVGKMADVVLWSGDPFSVYSRAQQVYNDGWLVYDRNDPKHQPRTDFRAGPGTPSRERPMIAVILAQTIALTGGTVYPVSGPKLEHATVVIQHGKITAVGVNVTIPADATRIDVSGKWVTPGLIDGISNPGTSRRSTRWTPPMKAAPGKTSPPPSTSPRV